MIRVILALIVFLGGIAAQPPSRPAPGRWFVAYSDDEPTARTLVNLVRGRLKTGSLKELSASVIPGPTDVVLRVGRAPIRGRGRTVKVSGVSTLGISLQPSVQDLRRTLARMTVAPGPVAVLGGQRDDWEGLAREVGAFSLAAVDRPAAYASLAERGAVLLIPDDPALLGVAEKAAQAATRAGVLTVTTAPWLAQTVCAVGVVPDLAAAAIAVEQRLARSDVPAMRVPVIRTLHLDVWTRVRGRPTGTQLSWPDRLHGGGGRRP